MEDATNVYFQFLHSTYPSSTTNAFFEGILLHWIDRWIQKSHLPLPVSFYCTCWSTFACATARFRPPHSLSGSDCKNHHCRCCHHSSSSSSSRSRSRSRSILAVPTPTVAELYPSQPWPTDWRVWRCLCGNLHCQQQWKNKKINCCRKNWVVVLVRMVQ